MPPGRGVYVIQIPQITSRFSFSYTFKSPHLCPLLSLSAPPTGWNKASLSVDASEENDGYSSGEDPMNSDPEDEVGKKLVSLSLKTFTFIYFAV